MKRLRVTVNGVSYDVEVEILEDDEEGGYGYSASHLPSTVVPPPVAVPPPRTVPHPSALPTAPAGGNNLTSPIAGVVKGVRVKPGDTVKENDPVVVIEAMKMETIVSSPVNGKIKTVNIEAGQNVQQGQVLVTFE